jgi:tetratricopeptide (TPR) repeat protein
MLESDHRASTRSNVRIWIAAGVLVALTVAFGAYYYVDRYVTPAGVVEAPDPIDQLEEKVRAEPGDADLRLSLAENYLLHRRYDEAVVQAEQVLEAYPKKDRALLVAGVAYSLSEQAEEALAPLTKFIGIREKAQGASLDTSLEAALYYQADSYLKLGRPADAVKALRHAVKISPTDADALHLLGTAYAASDKHAKAISSFERAIALVPQFRESYQGMAASYDATGQKVLGDYARAMVDFAAQDYVAARDGLLDVLAKKKDFAPAHLGLGLAYEQLGDLKSAREHLKAAIKQVPTSVAVQQALGRVEATIEQQAGS